MTCFSGFVLNVLVLKCQNQFAQLPFFDLHQKKSFTSLGYLYYDKSTQTLKKNKLVIFGNRHRMPILYR